MSSSDSEDDCYGNVAQKLQCIKDKYHTGETETATNTLNKNLSKEIGNSFKVDTNLPSNTVENLNISLNSTDNDELTLDAIIASNSTRRSRGRGKRKFNDDQVLQTSTERVTRSSRRKTGNSVQNRNSAPSSVHNITTETCSVEENRDATIRSRGRGSRRSRGRNSQPRGRGRGQEHSRSTSNQSYHIPTYSVGNTDEYPDMCDNQELFSTKSNDIIIIEEPDTLEDNEELSVKVYWQNLEVYKFNIRKYQKLAQIFEYFGKKEGIGHDKLLLTYNDRILKADDTPDTINYNIAKFIDGGIVNQNVTELVQHTNMGNIKNGIKIKFQCQNIKKPYEITVGPKETLAHVMMKYAEHIEKPLERLKFYFDGDLITGKSTPMELELEGGECIDVKLMS